jgi:uroporphyrinogen-III decarboxylase
MKKINSRQRLLNAIHLEEVDHIPCCFMSFAALRNRYRQDFYATARAELKMGLDAMLFIPSLPRSQRREHPDLRGLPIRFHPDVRMREWKEMGLMGAEMLFKEYHTPEGTLNTRIRVSEDWPHGDHIPFVDDYQIPRSLKSLVASPGDLVPLQYLLQPPHPADVAQFQQEVQRVIPFIKKHPVLLVGGWGVGMDMANWLCGMQNLMGWVIEQPTFVDQILEIIHQWNKKRMEVVLSAPIDLFIRRAWYEGCDFVTPRFFKHAILPRLKAEVELVHEHGVKFGYICSSGTKPMLDSYLEAGIDVLIGIDPVQGTHTDLPLIKEKLGERVCLWGGVSAAVTVETGGGEEIRAAVRQALQTLGPRGFILSPVDNITIDTPKTWKNIDIFIDAWRNARQRKE